MFDCLLNENLENYNNPHFLEHMKQEKFGLGDLKFMETESYVFENRKISKTDLCLSSFYSYSMPEDLISSALYFCDDASSFLTGVVIPIDIGFSAYRGV
jgi:hypothetical protein